jgi:hypothetical protein
MVSNYVKIGFYYSNDVKIDGNNFGEIGGSVE